MNSMYEIIMDLPLFQGMSHAKVSELIEKTRFHFLKFTDGDQIITAGEECEYVRFVISGKVRVSHTLGYSDVVLNEIIKTPNVLGVEFLFGQDRRYQYNVFAAGDCGVLQISKSDYVKILQTDNVFLFNLLNRLSQNGQRYMAGLTNIGGSVAQKFAFEVMTLTQKGSEAIWFEFRQKTLCQRLGVQRSSLINALEQLHQEQIVDYTSSSVTVLDRKRLVDLLLAGNE